VEFAHQFVAAPLDDVAAIKSGQEGSRIFSPTQQPEPEFLPSKRHHAGVGKAVDLDQMLEFQDCRLPA
jgi:hypothetical protein